MKRTSLVISAILVAATQGVAYAASANNAEELLPIHTWIFIFLIVGLTLWFGHFRFDRFSVAHGPEILTTLGIFGCFYGVSTGLWNFDTQNVAESVPTLLNGIKTAFWSSLFGVGGALYLKFRHAWTRVPIPQAGEAKAASLEDLVIVATRLQRGIVGDDEGSLIGQLKLMRQDQSDGFRELNNAFNSFAQKMAENNSKALIEALREVIRDFNEKLNEQFGENFKHLNAAVEKLVVWQKEYKEELDRIKQVQQQAASDFAMAATSLAKVAQDAESFSDTARNLHEVVVALTLQVERDFEAEKALHAALQNMKEITPEFSKKSAALVDDIRNGVMKTQGDLEAMVKGFASATQANSLEMRKVLIDGLTEGNKRLSSQIEAIAQDTRERVVKLDDALSKELSKSLETLGQQLTALSSRFVQDYSPLTDRLREVVRLAQRVQ